MASEKIEIKSLKIGTVQATMLGPLWARAVYTQKYPELLDDQKAIEIYKKIEVDLSEMEEYVQEWRAIGLMVRAKDFDNSFKKYLELHPETTVVNLGCGLDTTYFRVDNGNIKWYDLDLPDAIDYRKQFISESNRHKFIAKSVFDYSWFNEVEFDPKKGIFFIAGGLIYYFNEMQIKTLFTKMAEHFIGGEIIFDCISNLAIKATEKRTKKYIKQGKIKSNDDVAHFGFGVNKPKTFFSSWSAKLKVIDVHVIGNQVPLNWKWSKKTLIMNKIVKLLKTGKIVQLQFLS